MTEPATTPVLMGYEEAASALGVSEHWLRKQVREGRIPHTRLSDRVVRFTTADLDELMESRRVEAKVEKPKALKPSRTRRAS